MTTKKTTDTPLKDWRAVLKLPAIKIPDRTSDLLNEPTPQEWLNVWGDFEQTSQICMEHLGNVVTGAIEKLGSKSIEIPTGKGATEFVPTGSVEFAHFISELIATNEVEGQLDYWSQAAAVAGVSTRAVAYIKSPSEKNYADYREELRATVKNLWASDKAGAIGYQKILNIQKARKIAGEKSAKARRTATEDPVLTLYARYKEGSPKHEIAGKIANQLKISPQHIRRILNKANLN